MKAQTSFKGQAARAWLKWSLCVVASVAIVLLLATRYGIDEPLSYAAQPDQITPINGAVLSVPPDLAKASQPAIRPSKSEAQGGKPGSGSPDVYATWKRFPRGLGSTADQALQDREANRAVVLALQVKACMVIDDVINEDTKRLHRVERFDVERSGELRTKLESYISIKQDCSTLPTSLMEQQRLRDKLFALASEAGVVGAAAAAGPYNSDSPSWRQALLRDAQAGDLESMALVARLGVQFYGLSEQEARTYAYAALRAQDNWEAGVVSRARTASELMLKLARIEFSTARTGDSRESAWQTKVIPNPQYSEPTDPRLIQLGKRLDKAMVDLEKERASVGQYGVKRTGS